MGNNGQPFLEPRSAEEIVNELCRRGAGLATFDADGVLWRGDSGNGFLLWQIENDRLTREGRREAEAGWQAYNEGRLGDLELAVLCATCMRGLPEKEVAADAEAFFSNGFHNNIIPEVRQWVCRLQQAGVELWVVSGSHRWLIAAGARVVGVRDDRLLTVETVVRAGKITPEVILPVTYAEGKAEAIRKRLRRRPDMAVGNTFADSYMMEMAVRPVAVEPDAELAELAGQRNWPIVRFP